MAKKYYLGMDQGTTGTTTLLLDEKWNLVARGYKEHSQHYPQPGWVEHDPLEIWDSVLASISMALDIAGAKPDEIACIGLDNQGETVMLWDKETGIPVYNAIVWQDRRTARYADTMTELHGSLIREKTGLMIDAYFSATKIKWIIDNVPGVKDKIKEASKRAENVKGVFKAISEEAIKGKKILLIDDIFDSGATANECVRVLKQDPLVQKVYFLAIAKKRK